MTTTNPVTYNDFKDKLTSLIELEIANKLKDHLEVFKGKTNIMMFLNISAKCLNTTTKEVIKRTLINTHKFHESQIRSIRPSSDEFPKIIVELELDYDI